ncbi:CAF17-like 4Fe-4S cluster assembly/insertion protein YgfZ [Trichothermofontia sp.]
MRDDYTELQSCQTLAGATFQAIASGMTVPVSFGNEAAALAAVETGVALVDRCHWGRLSVSDQDRLRYLHNQTTNAFEALKPGQGCDTVFVTSTARTIDLVTAYVLDEAVLLLVSPNRREHLMAWMDRYIFFADRVQLADLTATTVAFSLLGPASDALIEKLGAGSLIGQPHAHHCPVTFADATVRLAVGSGLATPGYTLIADRAIAPPLWQQLTNWGAVPLGEHLWQRLRLEQGRPMPDHELTEDYNPLEAGLWSAVSFNKGCYIGQETIARLDTYQGVKQHLWGVRWQGGPVETGVVVTIGGERVGKLTSQMMTATGGLGLAYLRTKAGAAAGLQVQIGDIPATIVDLPFVSRGRWEQPETPA